MSTPASLATRVRACSEGPVPAQTYGVDPIAYIYIVSNFAGPFQPFCSQTAAS